MSDSPVSPLSGGIVRDLICYPIKGCAGMPVPDAVMTPAGLAHDRSFMVVDHDGVFRSQRRVPWLAMIRPQVSADGTRLTLGAPGVRRLRATVVRDGTPREVRLFGAGYRGIDQGDPVADWLTHVLGTPSRLVRVPPDHERVTDGDTVGTSGYADSSAVHLVSRASLNLLNQRLVEHGGTPLSMNRFRPNIVVDGWPHAHDEDRVRRITVGDAELGYAKRAIRCEVTMVDQETGRKSGPEPLRTLATYRRVAGGLAFGTNFAVTRPGRLSVGDPLVVTRCQDG